MIAPRRGGLLVALLPLLALSGCQTTAVLFPPNGSLVLRVADSGLTFAGAEPRGFQVISLAIDEASVDIDGAPTGSAENSCSTYPCRFDFLQGNGTCAFSDNVLLVDDFAQRCRGSGIALATGVRTIAARVRISSILLRAAVIPDLGGGGDYDGDGVIDRFDNCAIIANPAQLDTNDDGIGDACTTTISGVDVLDNDQDGIPDTVDNCRWVANPDQTDARKGGDFIGDACEQFTTVDLPGGSLELEYPSCSSPGPGCGGILTVDSSTVSRLSIDFAGAFDCTADLVSCRLDPARVSFVVD